MTKCKVFGKEYEFYLSVLASKKISSLCLNGLFENFDKTLESKSEADKLAFIADVIIILNKAAIMKRRFENDEPIGNWEEYDGLTYDILDCLDVNTFVNVVYKTALNAMIEDSKTEIEVEPEKKVTKATKSR